MGILISTRRIYALEVWHIRYQDRIIYKQGCRPLPEVYNPLIYTTPESHYLPSFPYMVDLQLFVLLRWPFIPTPMFLGLFTYICYQNCYTFLHPPVPAFPAPAFTALLSHTFFALSAQSCNLPCLVCVIFNTDEDPWIGVKTAIPIQLGKVVSRGSVLAMMIPSHSEVFKFTIIFIH